MDSLRIWVVVACVVGLGLPTWVEPVRPLGTLWGCTVVVLGWALAAATAAGVPWLLGRVSRFQLQCPTTARLPRGYLLGLDVLQLGLYAIQVLVFGWSELVHHTWGLASWVLVPKLLVLLPYLLGLWAVQIGLWPHVRERVARRLRSISIEMDLDAVCLPGEDPTPAELGTDTHPRQSGHGRVDAPGMESVTPPDPVAGDAARAAQHSADKGDRSPMAPRLLWFLRFQFRQQLAPIFAPLLAMMLMSDLMNWGYREGVGAVPNLQMLAPVLAFVPVVLLMLVVGPLVFVRALPTRLLREGPLKNRLQKLAEGVGFRSQPLRIWLTEAGVVNALVIGVVPRFRYVLLSDGLVAQLTPAQIEAVFAHEMAHCRRGHLVLLAAGAIAAAILASLLAELVWQGAESLLVALGNERLARLGMTAEVDSMPPMWLDGVVSTTAALLTLGALSRRFEREADLTAAHLLAEQRAVPPTETAELFCSALERAGLLAGVPDDQAGWWHDSVADRLRFLRHAAADPAFCQRFQRRIGLLKFAVVLGSAFGFWLLLGKPTGL